MTIVEKTPEQLVREDIQRQTLEAAAAHIEGIAGNKTYRDAWRVAARAIRSLKEKLGNI